jgi:hypothetical protein
MIVLTCIDNCPRLISCGKTGTYHPTLQQDDLEY